MSRLLTSKRQQRHTAKPVTGVVVINFLHVLKNLCIYNFILLFISKLTHKIKEIQCTPGCHIQNYFLAPWRIYQFNKQILLYFSLFLLGQRRMEQSMGSCQDSSA
jgi:hypothetical protein